MSKWIFFSFIFCVIAFLAYFIKCVLVWNWDLNDQMSACKHKYSSFIYNV